MEKTGGTKAEDSQQAHELILQQRSRLRLTGVQKIINYDEAGAVLDTVCGRLIITGKGLEVSELSTATGEVRISGRVDSVEYAGQKAVSGLMGRLLR